MATLSSSRSDTKAGTSLFYTTIREEIDQNVLVQMTKDVAAGMDHLATHGIVHRDLAARNLLVEVKRSGYHRVKVCDFGLALERAATTEAVRFSTEEQDQQQQRLSNVPVRWSAIEVLLHGRYTTNSDVWSFGITVWEIFSYGQTPYADLSTFEIVDLLLHGYKLPRPGTVTPPRATVNEAADIASNNNNRNLPGGGLRTDHTALSCR